MNRVKIYSTSSCPICDKAKMLLSKWGIDYEESLVDQDHHALRDMAKLTHGARTVPQFSIDGRWIGGFSELTELHMDGELAMLMGNQAGTLVQNKAK